MSVVRKRKHNLHDPKPAPVYVKPDNNKNWNICIALFVTSAAFLALGFSQQSAQWFYSMISAVALIGALALMHLRKAD